mmetsp:Transcript_40199/g.89199  ORF Transcript_40199/g.89199 Transcript_40199/m.89199 type:complete len:128 (+) Transcript_40199:144-527(+)|eukprot:CAMPEP_0202891270 /NCGR_PEP_ID=MMETSP1392-20130828/1376_1 /ASSEMBLY_ACC=CAM_ASM_000868 /TAXON_ID=225041 /ORGANISM="Chlamydomonas chlamydogama, Strain SAG 11-48b" /LENGTH=127 /DNA_ID=CAMNT_0049574973 /DNA_START=104 /DNA_END=487 /DNA_ORIENTATION=-
MSRSLCVALCLVLCLGLANAIPGGKSKSDPESESNRHAAAVAVEHINAGNGLQSSGVEGAVKLVKVKEVSTQVVAGLIYHFLMTVEDASGRQHDVSANLWSRPWLEGKNEAGNPAWQLTSVSLANNN